MVEAASHTHTVRAVTEWEEKPPERLILMPPEGFQHQTELAAASERGRLRAALPELPVAPVLAPRPGAGGAGLEQKCGRRMELPARACWQPPTPVTARISSRDMLAAAEEEERNGIGREMWIFSLLQKMRGCCWERKGEREGSPHLCPTPGKDRTRSNKGVFNPVSFLRGTWRRGAISKHAG